MTNRCARQTVAGVDGVDSRPPLTEKEFMRQVSDLARIFGWRVYHPWLSIHSERGWPDVAICKPPRLILAELKTERGKVSPHRSEERRVGKECRGRLAQEHGWRHDIK